MKLTLEYLLLAVAVAASGSEPNPSYFTNLRQVTVSAIDRQNYIAVDGDIWTHARTDLGDLRLYDGQTQVPYELKLQTGGAAEGERPARVLNLGVKDELTEFDLDVGALEVYDRVRLQLDAKDFIVKASIDGKTTLDQSDRTTLGTSTLFDFSREKLGSNTTLKFPTASFRYLHVRLSTGLTPSQVIAAYVYSAQEKKNSWISVGACQESHLADRHTEIRCAVPGRVPLDRILFLVPPGGVNFRRAVSVTDSEKRQIGSGTISRIRIDRGGTNVTSEELTVAVPAAHTGDITVSIDNGDDPPLHLDHVIPQALERRLYFEPNGKTSLTLYYGDDKLEAPVYDYAKLFHENPEVAVAQLGPGLPNPSYTGRPVDRPWSERHKTVLWIVMLVAVVTLAALAIQGLKSTPKTTS